MRLYGIIGYPLGHSFSGKYFTEKFKKEKLTGCSFQNFEIENEGGFKKVLLNNPDLKGLSVTIPYKRSIMSFLNNIDDDAKKIGAVNCIKIEHIDNTTVTTGYNTDVFGFEHSFKPLLKSHHNKALVLGSGGASKAVVFVLEKMNIDYLIVTRSPHGCKHIRYGVLHKEIMKEHNIIINTTPLGMYPDINSFPDIPYEFINKDSFLFDLVYNPGMTLFLKKGSEQGATVKNGLEMLHLQAEKAWEIWNNSKL
jgi:shikimate dehydrogenase